jgi:protein ImuB
MSRRYLSLWLPEWPLERMRLAARRAGLAFPPEEAPLALTAIERGVPRLAAVGPAARVLGLVPGMALADARAARPDLLVHQAEPLADAAELAALGLWCARYSPRVMVEGTDGLAIDLTGCSHLFGGERSLMADLDRRLARLGLTRRLAVAGRLAAAWAWARFGSGGLLPAEPHGLLDLPAAALGLEPELLAALRRLGLRRVGQLAALPRATLLTRFGPALPTRLDRLLGEAQEEFVPLHEPVAFSVRIGWPEPIGRTEDIAAATRHLLVGLAFELERRQLGVRRLALGLHRVDGRVARLAVGTSRPVREPLHLFRLLALELDGVDIGFGVEFMLLEALETAPLGAAQADLATEMDAAELDQLVDQLAQRLGAARVVRLQPVDSHLPERAQELAPAGTPLRSRTWLARQPRPLRLLPDPLPVEAMAGVPDGPPLWLHRRRLRERVLAAAGPERILPEWWRPEDGPARPRDYYRVATSDGAFWVSRDGRYGDPEPPRWRVQGAFA